jgi:hypothetical protein
MASFSPEMLAQLAQDEGTIQFNYTFDQEPSGSPSVPTTLITHFSPELRADLTLLPDGNLRWTRVRGADDGGYVELDVSELLPAKVWTVFLMWEPAGPRLSVGAEGALLQSHS